ncbi:MAG: hypothetical protein PHH81_01535 [Bacteroides graminisolvens]|nr:hypothetical protein [Bacteroides graminisolvens]
MKLANLLFFTILSVLSLLTFSCSKDDTPDAETSLLIGKWSLYKEDILYSEQDNQTPNETVTFNDGEEIVTFNSDGTYSSYYDSDIALGTYSYDTDNQEIKTSYIYEGKTYSGVAKVMELNSISLILYYTDEDGLSYIDYYKRKK